MIKLGRVKGNKMVDMQLTNNKLVSRGTRMIMDELKVPEKKKAALLLKKYGSVRAAIKIKSINCCSLKLSVVILHFLIKQCRTYSLL